MPDSAQILSGLCQQHLLPLQYMKKPHVTLKVIISNQIS